ncbi:MAG: hypothetical protein DRI75_09970 [Bacteroidetes bacterium]|nr:MAG: hypothetical protein DRI75_09970 [Bacteroidota bacterium]
MIIKKEVLYKWMLSILLFLPVAVASVEINVVVSLFLFGAVFLDQQNKFSISLINSIFPLILILIIASISSFFYPSTLYDNIKDSFFLLKPVLFILLGYILISKINNKDFIFKVIIYMAVFFAIIHLIEVFIFLLDHPFNVNRIRGETGLSNDLELFAIVFLIVNKKGKYFSIRLNYSKFIKILLYCSFILYFSRTMLVALFILIFAINGYTKFTRKGVIYIFLFLFLIIMFYMFLNSIDISSENVGIEGFLYKIKMAPAEIFYPSNSIDIKDHANLWEHWRAYEALKALEQLVETKYMLGLFFGKGLGSLVDLGFIAPLNSEGMQFIPKIHNGYINIMFKTGILGLLFYFIFLSYLYLQSYMKALNIKVLFINNLISGIGIYFAFTTLIVSGIYNQSDISAIILGVFLSLKSYYNQNIVYENSNIRH